jgi:hypothetical protein
MSSDCARLPACTGAISGAVIGIGESCQFQNRVRSIFSAALKRPSTASANTPPEGSGMISLLGAGRSRPRSWSHVRHASCSAAQRGSSASPVVLTLTLNTR